MLEFNTKELFNNEKLHQYDEDGQKGFLGYLIRKEEWKIEKDKIIFSQIKTDEQIERLLKDYDTSIMKTNIRIKKQILDEVLVFGYTRAKDILDDEIKEFKETEEKTKSYQIER